MQFLNRILSLLSNHAAPVHVQGRGEGFAQRTHGQELPPARLEPVEAAFARDLESLDRTDAQRRMDRAVLTAQDAIRRGKSEAFIRSMVGDEVFERAQRSLNVQYLSH